MEPPVDPDVAVAAEVLSAERSVLALVQATTTRHPALAGRLAPVAAAHEAHTALLADAVPEEALPAPSGSASPSDSGTSSPGPDGSGDGTADVPRNRARALRQVAAAEQSLATHTKQQAFKAESGAFARVLGSMAASAAQHAAVLAQGEEAGAS